MKGKLSAAAGRRQTFVANFAQLGYQRQTTTVLLKNVRLLTGELVVERACCAYTETFGHLGLSPGDVVQFDAYTQPARREGDCRLTDPTRLKKLPFDLWRGLGDTQTLDAAWSEKAKRSGLERLTNRECQVLELLARGDTSDQIAQQLGLSSQTVRNCLSAVYRKLGVGSRTEALRWAREHVFIPPT